MSRLLLLPSLANGLCLDPPFSTFVDRLTTSVHVEASQIDFSSFQNDVVLCDSTEGPLCHLLYADSDGPTLTSVFGSDMFSRTLGIPPQVSVTISGPQLDPNADAHASYLGYRLRQLNGNQYFQSSQSRQLSHGSHTFGFDKRHPVGFAGRGWFMDGDHRIMLVNTESKIGYPSIVFGTTLVVQNLRVLPHGSNSSVLLVGKLQGREQWRSESDSLLGKIVFARWRGNNSIFRGKVLFDEGPLGATISWADGDGSHRQVARSDIVSVVPGDSENLREIDEIEFVHSGLDPKSVWFELADLVVTIGRPAPPVKVIRSGGGMVFEDQVSAGSVMYSVSDLISRRWRVQNSVETRRDFGQYFLMKTFKTEKVVSMRNIVLLWKWSVESAETDSNKLIKLLVQNINSELVSQFLNLNDFASAVIDQTPGTYAAMFQFQTWLKFHQGPATIGSVAAIASGDMFEGSINCVLDPATPNAIMFKLEVISIGEGESNKIPILVRIKYGANFATKLAAQYIPSLGLLQIPANDMWKHAMSLFYIRSDEFTIELIGTGNDMGCGAVVMAPIYLEETTRTSFKSVEIANISELKNAFYKFNNFLIKSHGRNMHVHPHR